MKTFIFFINHFNLELLINIIASLSTAVSAWLVYITLKEMKTQRDTAYKPLLVLDTKKEVEISSKNGLINPEKSAEIIDSGKFTIHVMHEGSETLIIKLQNIGVGAAKNLSYQFNKNNFLEFFEMEAVNNSNFYYEDKETKKCIRYGYKNSDGFWELHYSNLSNSYLLPGKDHSIEIYLPQIIIKILQRSLKNKYYEAFSKNIFSIDIYYEDIQGNDFNTSLPLEINMDTIVTSVYDGVTRKDIPLDKRETIGYFKIKLF